MKLSSLKRWLYWWVNTAKDARLLSFQSPASKVGHWLTARSLDLGRIRTMDECLNCANNMVYGEHLLSFWGSRIWACNWPRVPTWPALDKPPATKSLTSFPGWQHFTCVITVLQEELGMSCATPLGKDPGKLAPGVLWASPACQFPLRMCCVALTLTRHSCECHRMLSLLSVPSQSPNLGLVLGTPDTMATTH